MTTDTAILTLLIKIIARKVADGVGGHMICDATSYRMTP